MVISPQVIEEIRGRLTSSISGGAQRRPLNAVVRPNLLVPD
jgi:hypothetical protein